MTRAYVRHVPHACACGCGALILRGTKKYVGEHRKVHLRELEAAVVRAALGFVDATADMESSLHEAVGAYRAAMAS